MAAMNLELGPSEVSPDLPQAFAAKPPNLSPPTSRIAILVAHGMGQQVPYETIDGVAQAAARGIADCGETLSKSVIRSVRLETLGAAETDLVRAEMQIKEASGQEHEVHVYEAYWAPITEGKVSATDVVNFLLDAGCNGILNTTARTYRRWMFGAEQQFLLATERLTFAFLGVMALLLSLVFINSIAAAAAASHAIGSTNPFPSAHLLPLLTWDFVLVDAAALLIALGVFAFGRISPKTFPWSFIYAGAFLIVLSALFMAGHLAQCPFLLHVVPGHRWCVFVSKHSLAIVALWVIEIGAASKARQFLIQYVGDVAAYIAAHTVSKFWEVRQQIWQTAMKVGEAVYRARTADDSGFLYTKIIVVGHSLGSVIGYDLLNGLLMDDQFSAKPLDVGARTKMFLTFGSPLDKTAFLFRTQKDMRSQVREVAAAAVQPMIADYRSRPEKWVNLWSKSDIISGHLDFYDPPNVMNAKHPEHYVHAMTNPKAVQNHIDPDAKTPLKAHIEYWNGKLFAELLYRAITNRLN